MEKVLKYTEKEVNFDSVKIPQILYEHGPLGRKGKIEYNDDEVTYIDDKPFINAVDIDWNGIEIENNNRINTTADLINWIKNKISNTSNIELEEISVPATCYRWYNINATPIIPIQNIKNPQSEDNEAAFPEYNWSEYAINRPEGQDWVLYLCSGTKTISTNTYSWKSITRISGIDGTAGEDSNEREWIYKTFTQQQTFSSNNNNPSYWNISQQPDYLGPNRYKWSDNPQGVSIENKFEYTSYRDYKNGSWTRFSQPILWSHYGINGIDGDGIEYCYVRTRSKVSIPEVVSNSESQLSDEYLPIVKISKQAEYVDEHGDISGSEDISLNNNYSYARCTDNPVGVNGIWKYEWVITRKKSESNDEGKRIWNNYSGNMSLWSSWTIGIDSKITIKDGFWWCNGDYLRDDNGNAIRAEGGDGSQGVEVVNFCPGENNDYPVGTIAYCKNTGYTSIKTGDNTWYNLGETSGTGNILHIAYAQDINFTTRSFTGFSKTNNQQTAYPWIGFLVDDKKKDPDVGKESQESSPENDPIWNAFMEYKWNYVRGRDGNGVEYIFMLSKEGYTPEINQTSYEVEELTDSELSQLVSGHSNRDEDEFFPIVNNFNGEKFHRQIWYDDPPEKVSETWPILWKAIRKKVNGEWQSFRPPKKENQYFAQTSAYIITSDNDTIVLDDQSTSKEDLESASLGTLTLIYNNTPVIKDITWVINSKYDIFLPYSGLTVDLNENTGAFKVKYKEDGTATVQSNFVEGQYYFIVSAAINNSIVAQKKIAFIVKNISIDGSFYRLVIQNDSQSYKSDGTPNNNSNPIISVHKIKDGKSEQITEDIKLINDTTNLSEDSGITLVIPNGLKGTYVDGNSTVSIDYSNPNKLPITLKNVAYEQGGYDIALYYDEELLDAEHIDCVKDGKDGKDASISDGITIARVDRYYQATNTNNTYPDPYTTNSNGWHEEQIDADWSASNPYLYIQDKTTYSNDTSSWGQVELYSYWGNENYDLVVSPQHIILDEKVNEENEDRSYSGTNTVTVTLYKSGTEDSIIPRIQQNYEFFIKEQNLIEINNNNNTKTATITININNIKEYLKNSSDSEGYLSFTVKGYEVYDESKTDNTYVFIRQVKVPVYINRAESKLFSYKGKLKKYIDDQDNTIVQDYNASIEATQKRLTSQFTESIGTIGSRNFFGFTNAKISNSSYPCVPFIQGYGVVINGSLNSHRGGRVQNLGFNGIGGTYTVSCSMRMSNSTTSVKASLCGKIATTINNKVPTDGKTTVPYNYWQGKTFIFELTDAQAANNYLDFEAENVSTSDDNKIYIRHLKIERGNTAPDFCESDEDINTNVGEAKDLLSLSISSGVNSGNYTDKDGETRKGYSYYYNSTAIEPTTPTATNNWLQSMWLVNNGTVKLEAGKIYTLSYYAYSSQAGTRIFQSFHANNGYGINIVTNVGVIYTGGGYGAIREGVEPQGNTFVTLSSAWKQYFVYFYVVNNVSAAALKELVVMSFNKVTGEYNNTSAYVYMADIHFQEGYIMSPASYSSLIEQTARRLSLAQYTGTKKAGIDIYDGKIKLTADNVGLSVADDTQMKLIDFDLNQIAMVMYSGNNLNSNYVPTNNSKLQEVLRMGLETNYDGDTTEDVTGGAYGREAIIELNSTNRPVRKTTIKPQEIDIQGANYYTMIKPGNYRIYSVSLISPNDKSGQDGWYYDEAMKVYYRKDIVINDNRYYAELCLQINRYGVTVYDSTTPGVELISTPTELENIH